MRIAIGDNSTEGSPESWMVWQGKINNTITTGILIEIA
jgi:hypothetical protein